jgi:hypothetical protein
MQLLSIPHTYSHAVSLTNSKYTKRLISSYPNTSSLLLQPQMLAHIPLSLFLPPSLSAPPHALPSPSALPAQPPKPTRSFTQTPKPIERTHYCGVRSKSSCAILVKPTLAYLLTKTKMLSFSSTEQSQFIQNIAQFLCTWYSHRANLIELSTTTGIAQNPMLVNA